MGKERMIPDLDGSMISVSAAARKYGISDKTIHSRLRRGVSGEELFKKHEPRCAKKCIEYNGELISLYELAMRTGKKYDVILYRWKRGITDVARLTADKIYGGKTIDEREGKEEPTCEGYTKDELFDIYKGLKKRNTVVGPDSGLAIMMDLGMYTKPQALEVMQEFEARIKNKTLA